MVGLVNLLTSCAALGAVVFIEVGAQEHVFRSQSQKKIDVQPSLNTAKSHVLAFSFLAFVVKTKPPSPIMMDGQITKKGCSQCSQLSKI